MQARIPTVNHLRVLPPDGEAFERPLEGESIVIGRSSECDLVIADRFLSRKHAELFQDGGACQGRCQGQRQSRR